VDVFLRGVVRRVVGAGVEPHEPRPRRIAPLLIANEPYRLVREVLGKVVALFWCVRWVDEPIVLGEIRIPLVGLTAYESVVAVEPHRQRPHLSAPPPGHNPFGEGVSFSSPTQ